MYTHDFFPFPAKFPPGPINEFIHEYSHEGDHVLDPFCGSGTVLVESLLNNRDATGIDLNPLSALVSRAKATRYDHSTIDELNTVIRQVTEYRKVRDEWLLATLSESDLPNYKNIELWFKPNMRSELAAIRKSFLLSGQYQPKTKTLLWMAFLKIIVPVSNQDTDTRYTAVSKVETIDGYALHQFRETLVSYVQVLNDSQMQLQMFIHQPFPEIAVHEGDSLTCLKKIPNNSVDLVITSPPYINTFDYYLYHKHRIFWMGGDPQSIRKQEVGCHHRIDTMTYDAAHKEYEEYLLEVFDALYKKLRPGKRFVILIGDGIVKGEIIAADALTRRLADKTGFTVERELTVPIREVSRGFLKGRNLDLKKHHSIVMRRSC